MTACRGVGRSAPGGWSILGSRVIGLYEFPWFTGLGDRLLKTRLVLVLVRRLSLTVVDAGV